MFLLRTVQCKNVASLIQHIISKVKFPHTLNRWNANYLNIINNKVNACVKIYNVKLGSHLRQRTRLRNASNTDHRDMWKVNVQSIYESRANWWHLYILEATMYIISTKFCEIYYTSKLIHIKRQGLLILIKETRQSSG